MAVSALLLGGCSSDSPSDDGCEALTGTPWVPDVSDKNGTAASDSNHDGSVTVSKDTYTGSGLLTGLYQSFSKDSAHVITFSNIDMSSDLGTHGSLSLVAEVTGYPEALATYGGYGWPVLVSLHDGTNELVNVTGVTGGTGCFSQGFYSSCSSGGCNRASGCDVAEPSAFLGDPAAADPAKDRFRKWEQHQKIMTTDQLSVNSFPTCAWASGSPACPFNSTFFNSGKLRTGTYTAKYVVLTNYSTVDDTYPIGVRLSVLRKTDSSGAGSDTGAIDLNMVLVGTSNIQASRTDKGKQNLNELLRHVFNHYYVDNNSSVGVKIGKVTVYEWTCEQGGDTYANSADLGAIFKNGSSLVQADSEGKAMNVFLTSTVGGNLGYLGVAGGIVGPMINGTTASGLVFASFDKLATYNSSCTGSGSCPITSQDAAFIDMGSTISHEMGHFLGLNHPSESTGTTHDKLPDSPQCDNLSGGKLTISSCRSEAACDAVCTSSQYSSNPYCADKSECQFNHVMWYSGKNYNSSGQGDGNIFSTNSGTIINYSPYVR